MGPLDQKRSVGESHGNRSRMCSYPGDGGAMGVPPHGALHLEQAHSLAHSALLAAAQC
jgi:hypothetical protein